MNKINKNFLMVSNHNADISWILDYTDNYIIYDRSDTDEWVKPFDPKKVRRVKNVGWDIYDKFTYIIDNYDNLPESMILTKGNIFKYITKEEFDAVLNNQSFTPLHTKHHKTKLPIAFYSEDGMYNEINNSWYLGVFPARYFESYNQFVRYLGLPEPEYVKFAPGSNYIVQRDIIRKHSKEFYKKLRECVGYTTLPGEAQIIERFMYTMWTSEKELKAEDLHLHAKNPLLLFFEKKVVKFIKKYFFRPAKAVIRIFLIYIKNLPENKEKSLKGTRKHERKIPSKEEILEYKKKIKIYDVFYFFNELDILEIRLNILSDYVDYFVIIESTESFSGAPHKLCFKENEARFAKWKDKIIYYVVDDFPEDQKLLQEAKSNSNVGAGEHYWVREFYQKESAKKALANLEDEDIVFISDCDEIWNPLKLKELTDFSKAEIIRPKQLAYYYYLNNRCSEVNGWTGTIVTKYKNIKNGCINDIRTRSKTKYKEIDYGGWHFGFMGGVEGAMKKLTEWKHPEYMGWISTISKRVEKNQDYRGRRFKFWTDESDLPKYILENKKKYAKMFKSNEKF